MFEPCGSIVDCISISRAIIKRARQLSGILWIRYNVSPGRPAEPWATSSMAFARPSGIEQLL